MSSIKCKVGWHDWNKYGPMIEAYSGLCQFRSCKECGAISYIKCYGNQARAENINKSLEPKRGES